MRSPGATRLTAQMSTVPYDDSEQQAREQALLVRLRGGDERALGSLLECHRRPLELYCLLMLGDRAKVPLAVRETALQAWDARVACCTTTSPRVWLFAITVRVCARIDPDTAISFGAEDRLPGEQR